LHDPVYRPDACAYCQAETWCEYRRDGRPQCRACKIERFVERLLYPPLKYRLDWGRQLLRDIYGTVETETGERRYLRAYISMAKKNGKSLWAAGLPLYHLLCENEPHAEAYGVAAARDQATVIFRHVCEFVKANPALKDKLRILPSTKRILRRDGSGFYAVLSADGDLQDGVEPSLNIFDEVHRWKTAKAQTLYDVLTKGTISRREPLTVEVTTSGEEHGSPIWRKEHDLAQKVLSGALPAERFYARIWAADQKRLEAEPEYWKSREARLAANPSHQDYGGFLRDDKILEELKKAMENPGDRPKYLRYHLNLMVSSIEERAIDMDRWQKCGGGLDLRTWPTYDVEYLIRKWNLMGKPCWAGADASWTTDLTALSLVFPPFDTADTRTDYEKCSDTAKGITDIVPVPCWTILMFYWMPAELVGTLERKTHAPLSNWVARGFIEATPGDVIDLQAVKDKIAWADEMFEVREVPFDPWNFTATATDLIDKGFTCIKIPQVFSYLSAPTKKLVDLYVGGKLRHGNNPVLNWNAGCLAFQGDRKDNVQPAKPERAKSQNRIDGISATVTALARAMSQPVEIRPQIAVF